ncbi:MAG: fibronectin type III domain-containing protein [Candidatus Eisenbacteria bacterium]|uniref:Fibronectin type III domain-containing protein n=1 Tax=Eiseniibacteriota bacterium TaxID=2212470 RepID=A0A849SMQ7_UNCEI|nr:fibronectin type III domain-containing protein [Candidatus Eisenbacteria bacterium]
MRPFRLPDPLRVVALLAWVVCAVAFAGSAGAQDSTGVAQIAPAAPSGLTVSDVANDAGRQLELNWKRSPDDRTGSTLVTFYQIERADQPGGPWEVVDSVAMATESYVDQSVRREQSYFYRVSSIGPGGLTPALSVTGPAVATSQFFNTARWSVLVYTLGFFAFVMFFIARAQSGQKTFLRRIPGVDAIEEAIGRATEMGRPVLYIPGILDIDDIQTVAGLVILESVAKLTARYQTAIRVPVTYPIPFAIAQDMVKNGYLSAGRPDAHDPDAVQFVSPEQFAYVANVGGIMLRDRPGAHIFMGAFYAESLLLAETGFQTGAIQVAGTANVHQLPFFVVACDYTLIGEELFAAGAYLSGDPKLVGSLKAIDLMKITLLLTILVGCALETLGHHGFTNWMATQ